MVSFDTITAHLTNVVSIIQERMQRLCQEIEKHVKLGKTIKEKMPTCKITEAKTKLIEVMKIMLDNRLEFNEEYFPQCGKRLQESVFYFGSTVFYSMLPYNVSSAWETTVKKNKDYCKGQVQKRKTEIAVG